MKTMKIILATIVMACFVAAVASCDRGDEDSNDIPSSVKTAMYGSYENIMTYGNAYADNTMAVTLTSEDITFNIPARDILRGLVASDELSAALQTLSAKTVTTKYTPVRYYKGVATLMLEPAECQFAYKKDGRNVNCTARISTASAVYNEADATLTVVYTISSVAIGGATSEDFQSVSVALVPVKKK